MMTAGTLYFVGVSDAHSGAETNRTLCETTRQGGVDMTIEVKSSFMFTAI